MGRKFIVCTYIFLISCILFILFFNESIGLANNGDFQRVANPLGIQIEEDDGYFYFNPYYQIQFEANSTLSLIKKAVFAYEKTDGYLSV